MGHFPPFSYPANGYLLVASEERDWLVDGFPVHGKRYHFERRDERGAASVVVDSFMVLGDGSTTRDLDGVNRSAQDLRRRHIGAAQVQVRTDAAMDDEHRDRVFRDLVKGCLPAIREKSPGVDE